MTIYKRIINEASKSDLEIAQKQLNRFNPNTPAEHLAKATAQKVLDANAQRIRDAENFQAAQSTFGTQISGLVFRSPKATPPETPSGTQPETASGTAKSTEPQVQAKSTGPAKKVKLPGGKVFDTSRWEKQGGVYKSKIGGTTLSTKEYERLSSGHATPTHPPIHKSTRNQQNNYKELEQIAKDYSAGTDELIKRYGTNSKNQANEDQEQSDHIPAIDRIMLAAKRTKI